MSYAEFGHTLRQLLMLIEQKQSPPHGAYKDLYEILEQRLARSSPDKIQHWFQNVSRLGDQINQQNFLRLLLIYAGCPGLHTRENVQYLIDFAKSSIANMEHPVILDEKFFRLFPSYAVYYSSESHIQRIELNTELDAIITQARIKNQVVVVEGEPGAGKSTLIEQVRIKSLLAYQHPRQINMAIKIDEPITVREIAYFIESRLGLPPTANLDAFRESLSQHLAAWPDQISQTNARLSDLINTSSWFSTYMENDDTQQNQRVSIRDRNKSLYAKYHPNSKTPPGPLLLILQDLNDANLMRAVNTELVQPLNGRVVLIVATNNKDIATTIEGCIVVKVGGLNDKERAALINLRPKGETLTPEKIKDLFEYANSNAMCFTITLKSANLSRWDTLDHAINSHFIDSSKASHIKQEFNPCYELAYSIMGQHAKHHRLLTLLGHLPDLRSFDTAALSSLWQLTEDEAHLMALEVAQYSGLLIQRDRDTWQIHPHIHQFLRTKAKLLPKADQKAAAKWLDRYLQTKPVAEQFHKLERSTPFDTWQNIKRREARSGMLEHYEDSPESRLGKALRRANYIPGEWRIFQKFSPNFDALTYACAYRLTRHESFWINLFIRGVCAIIALLLMNWFVYPQTLQVTALLLLALPIWSLLSATAVYWIGRRYGNLWLNLWAERAIPPADSAQKLDT